MLIEDGLVPVAATRMRKIFKNKIIAAGGFEPESAEAIIERRSTAETLTATPTTRFTGSQQPADRS